MTGGTQPPSLARYAVARSPGVDLYNGSPSRDFCNSFWGDGEAGVNILFTRVRGVIKTSEELVNFWKERSTIEEEYAARLLALSRTALGEEEVGDLRTSIDTLRLETEKQAEIHNQLATQIRNELEVQTQRLLNQQTSYKHDVVSPLEKQFKVKQQQESYVVKAREKYEGDCLRISSYTQQLNYTSGKDLERLQSKLKRAQQTVQANEKDFAYFTKTLAEMLPEWESEWKKFCDQFQDMEEQRLEFMKDTLWAYANGVSTLCVSDDQSCERIRIVLDQLEPDKEIESFVNEFGTGNAIPDPPVFVPYPQLPPGAASPTSSLPHAAVAPQTIHYATFQRISSRPAPQYPSSVNPDIINPNVVAKAPQTHQQPPPPQQQPAYSYPGRVPSPTDSTPTRSEGSIHHTRSGTVGSIGAGGVSVSASAGSGAAAPSRSAQPPHPPPTGSLPPAPIPSSQVGLGGGNASIPTDPAPVYPPDPYLPYGPNSGGHGATGVIPGPGGVGVNGASMGRSLSVSNSVQGMQAGGGGSGPPPARQPSTRQAPLPTPQAIPGQPQMTELELQQQQSQRDSVQGSNGNGQILFYVKALYDYTATIEEEFDFQAGDVIAVTAAPEDGWWSGELLDENRREPGRHIFPSNFVCLF
ncbi:FCH-domain-containing protein [Pluteus cervinus]|uniref:FCH-domain-containing protein n=1 Tax=Pluteus cervinus TaxID=181527 RepID=A0ACD3AJ63_9AGAR|nr:FCH-domain-containing protein [Pluteus cervinus]